MRRNSYMYESSRGTSTSSQEDDVDVPRMTRTCKNFDAFFRRRFASPKKVLARMVAAAGFWVTGILGHQNFGRSGGSQNVVRLKVGYMVGGNMVSESKVKVSLSSSFLFRFIDFALCFVSAEYGFSCVDPVVLGISLDLKTIHDSAPDYKFGKENPRNPRLKDYVLSPSGVARISEVRADPWDSASSPEAVPVKVVLPDLRTTSDPDQRKRKGSTLLRPSAHPKKAKASQSSEKEEVSEVMPPPKNLLHFMPLPGQKLKSVVVAEPPPVDQPLAEEDTIPSPLKPSAALGIEIQDITKVMEAIEADLVPGSDVPTVAE
ncbi:uncharacterized protein [Spinacia oleracea]|uniref:Uncharacterized protein n=1 Tax=Spinacia oleracea TaxID=3562 RepID=A0ABM3RQE0_SPIOL|nr:uncharacterized protein LOC130471629 [Spinacia oleracea]